MYIGHGHLCVPVFVCLSRTTFLHCCMYPDVTLVKGRGCPLVVHHLVDFQPMHGFHCCDNIHIHIQYYGPTLQCKRVSYWSTLVLFWQLPVKFSKALLECEMLASFLVLALWLVPIIRACWRACGHSTVLRHSPLWSRQPQMVIVVIVTCGPCGVQCCGSRKVHVCFVAGRSQ